MEIIIIPAIGFVVKLILTFALGGPIKKPYDRPLRKNISLTEKNEEFFEKFGLFKIDDTRRKNTFKRTKSFLQRDASESHRCRQVHHSCGWNKEST